MISSNLPVLRYYLSLKFQCPVPRALSGLLGEVGASRRLRHLVETLTRSSDPPPTPTHTGRVGSWDLSSRKLHVPDPRDPVESQVSVSPSVGPAYALSFRCFHPTRRLVQGPITPSLLSVTDPCRRPGSSPLLALGSGRRPLPLPHSPPDPGTPCTSGQTLCPAFLATRPSLQYARLQEPPSPDHPVSVPPHRWRPLTRTETTGLESGDLRVFGPKGKENRSGGPVPINLDS